MTHLLPSGRRRPTAIALAFGLLFALLAAAGLLAPWPAAAQSGPYTPRLWLPVVTRDYVRPEERLCRLGVDFAADIASYPIRTLRAGWYLSWGAWANPLRPGGISVAMSIRLDQPRPTLYGPRPKTYSMISPTGATITNTVLSNPGAIWPIGNEPDRPYFQDDIEPDVYARAYHDLYYQIKRIDPTAQIAAGNIVEPTPLRLKYLDLVLSYYKQLYGAAMPVDVWSIHTYPIREQSCNQDKCGSAAKNCWGADIPPGVDACSGKLYVPFDSIEVDRFEEFVDAFRGWMADNGYRDKPLILPEVGVLMPPDVVTDDQVLAYMNWVTNFVMTAQSSTLGYPADSNRLVQRLAWFSLANDARAVSNGWLFDSSTKLPTKYGNNYARIAAKVSPSVNLTLTHFQAVPVAGQPNSVKLAVDVANNGNIGLSYPAIVRFRLGSPTGAQIGPDLSAGLIDGCALPMGHVEYTWTGAQSGSSYTVFAVADPGNVINETNETDNTSSVSFTR